MARASAASLRERERGSGSRAARSRITAVEESAENPREVPETSLTAADPCDTLATALGARGGQTRTTEDNGAFGKPLKTLSLSVLECPGQDIQTGLLIRGSRVRFPDGPPPCAYAGWMAARESVVALLA